jgi:hypothetical protein
VEVQHAKGKESIAVNQQKAPPIEASFISLGTFDFTTTDPAAVVVSNAGANGYVVIDAVQWVPAQTK